MVKLTEEQTLEYNKMCAEFLKNHFKKICDTWEAIDSDSCFFVPTSMKNGEVESYGYVYNANTMQFHSDWNWIHEVIDAIEEIDAVGSVQIDKPTIYIWASSESSTFKNVEVEITSTKQEAVVAAIFQFLLWYFKRK